MPDPGPENVLFFKKTREYDVFKDTPIRYLGYANEVGEAFRVLVPVSVVNFSYVVASSYVAADAFHKGYKTWQKLPDESYVYKCKKSSVSCVDTLIWQGFASVIIPGFTINRICWFSRRIIREARTLPPAAQKWTVVAIGLGSIPFIIKPIDKFVDFVMDKTIRKLYF